MNFGKFLTIIFKIAIWSRVAAIEDKKIEIVVEKKFERWQAFSNGHKESTKTIGSSKKLYAKGTTSVTEIDAIHNPNLNTKFKVVSTTHIGTSCKIPQRQNVTFTLTKIRSYVSSMTRDDYMTI